MKKTADNVAGYIASAPAWARGTLRQIRRVIRSAAPKAKESIGYRMPYYSQDGRLGYFAAYANHCSFHWVSGNDKKVFAKELAKAKVVGSTIQIPKGGKVPSALIKMIIKARLRQNAGRKSKLSGS